MTTTRSVRASSSLRTRAPVPARWRQPIALWLFAQSGHFIGDTIELTSSLLRSARAQDLQEYWADLGPLASGVIVALSHRRYGNLHRQASLCFKASSVEGHRYEAFPCCNPPQSDAKKFTPRRGTSGTPAFYPSDFQEYAALGSEQLIRGMTIAFI
jgi:hypothetical protein